VTAPTPEIEAPPSHRIRCGGIWGGITEVDLDVRTQAISASVQSTASGSARGGDIYYLSLCSGDVVTRVALADVRGHGEQVSPISQWLYDSLEQRINHLDGAGVLADLNSLACEHGFDALTTAAVVTYYSGDSTLSYSYAGHPPILVRKGHGAWTPKPIENDAQPANLPLGVMRSVRYDVATVGLSPGDRVFLYTDGVVECADHGGDFYGDDRLLDVLERTANLSLSEVKSAVFESLIDYAGGELVHDDCTLMVLEVRDTD
jgi:phosphoserine phosphatase RsbU/P